MKISVYLGIVISLLCGGCASRSPDLPPPGIRDTDPMITQLSTTARKAFDAGEVASAVVMYRRALERARAIDNSQEIAANAYNLAACLLQLGAADESVKLLAEAEREAARSGGDQAAILLMSAQTARARGDASAAEATLDRLEALDVSREVRGQAYVMRANIACDRQNPSMAEGFLSRASDFAGASADSGLSAAIANVSGRIAMLEEQWLDAAVAFDREAEMMQQSLRPAEMAAALEQAGKNYIAAGKTGLAADRYYRSARSWMAQGDYLDALRVIEQAAQLNPVGEDSAQTMTVIASLFDEIRRSVEQQRNQAGVSQP